MVYPSLNVLGLMSGTSLDGLDLALVEVSFSNEKYHFKIKKAATIKYSNEWEELLKNARFVSGVALTKLHIDYGRYLGGQIIAFTDESVDLISSHGHTVFHQPNIGVTLQIGSLNEIASVTGVKTVGDFRTLDVAKGGEGAPLVPIGDQFLFGEYDYCINLGGISNISYLENGIRKAMDLSPCNIVSNIFSAKLGRIYDEDGTIGRKGNINTTLLNLLNEWSFYSANDSSLSIEKIEEDFLPIFSDFDISIEDKLRTYYEHLGIVIGSELKEGVALFTGGGVKNSMILSCIESNTKTKIITPTEQMIDFKEAVIFAFLGYLRVNNKTNILASVTGAVSDSCSGVVIIP